MTTTTATPSAAVTTPPPAPAPPHTVAELIDRLGGISPGRILMHPPPGLATEADLLARDGREGPLCELVEGVLVEKVMGYGESLLTTVLIEILSAFVRGRNLGLVSGSDGLMRLMPGVIRVPDAAFVAWDRVPTRRRPRDRVAPFAPDLAVKVLSQSNTPAEMMRKRQDYFTAGTLLDWQVDPDGRTVTVYTSADQPDAVLVESDTLDGGRVLPGFLLPLRELFAELDREAP